MGLMHGPFSSPIIPQRAAIDGLVPSSEQPSNGIPLRKFGRQGGGAGHEKLRRQRRNSGERRGYAGGGIALRDESACGHYHQRDGFFGGAGTEPENRARLSAAGEGKDGVVARTGPNVSRGWAIRAFQDDNEVRRKGRTRTASLSTSREIAGIAGMNDRASLDHYFE